jgi:hypothetical protein
MYELAADDGPEFAKAWSPKNSCRLAAGTRPRTFGRFWDGPPPVR